MPVVVYYGDESFLLEQALVRLRSQVVNPAMASLSHRVLSQPSLAAVLEAVGGVSLALGGQTLIEIRDFGLLHQAARDAGTDAQLEELKGLLTDLEPTKTVLFASTKLDGKIKFAKWITKQPGFTVQKFEAFKFWETEKVADFLLAQAEARGVPLQPAAADTLVDMMGTDLRTLVNELGKLALYAPGRPITPADVLKMAHTGDHLFALINDWIGMRVTARNYADLQETLLKRHPVEVFAVMQSYFNNIFRVLWLHTGGASVDAITRQTGQKPFTIKKHLSQFAHVSRPRLLQLKTMLVNLEWQAKTGRMDGHLALETLLGI